MTCKYNINDLNFGKTYIQKENLSGMLSDLSYGIAIDINYNKTYKLNNKTFSPYSSDRSIEKYLEFVKELGNEEDCGNINYILYKYAFKDAGFVWGGTPCRNDC